MRWRTHELRPGQPYHGAETIKIIRGLADHGLNGHLALLGAFGAEDRDRNRSALRIIIALDADGDVVAQPGGFGALDKAALRTGLHQRETATALTQEIRGARTVGQERRGARHEDEARLVKARCGGLRPDADDVAQCTR